LRRKPTKTAPPALPPPVETAASDRLVLVGAYKAGLIQAWKLDAERGYRLSFADRPDEYVEVAKLPRYLEKLGRAS
jgi:hypothetical protein